MTLTAQKAKDLGVELRKAGLKVYVETPREHDSFEMLVRDSGDIEIYPGPVDLKIFPDPTKRFKQVVMWADERGHTNQRKVEVRRPNDSYSRREFTLAKWKEQFETGRHFGLAMPEGTIYKCIEGPKFEKRLMSGFAGREGQKEDWVVATVRAVVPDARWTFLLGTDERSQFISALPKRVRTVNAAHKALRPKGITEKTTRQGEWFFVPATRTEAKKLDAMVAHDPSKVEPVWLGAADDKVFNSGREWDKDEPEHADETDTSHAAFTSLHMDDHLFVTGYIVDDRTPEGRNSRHEPLWLPDWHRVVRNLEIQVPGMDTDGFD